ncbi:MAG TPA: cupredoxin domain-containing protein, partial [Anaerolineaceae bacterium]|nr:cupredoxin domain-containing protein [Anaerolineaceae bacterium]
PGAPAAVTLQLSATDNQFSTNQFTVPAGAQVVIEFVNNDAVPHNFALFESSALENEIFVGDTITGPGESITYEFTAPDTPGDYYFLCTVHPFMNGTFTVE